MYTGGEDCTVRLYDLRQPTMTCVKLFQVVVGATFTGAQLILSQLVSPVHTVCVHPNQVELFVGDVSGTLSMWDLRNDTSMQMCLEVGFVGRALKHGYIRRRLAARLSPSTRRASTKTRPNLPPSQTGAHCTHSVWSAGNRHSRQHRRAARLNNNSHNSRP
jgi:WD40 repeat protein